MPHANAVKRQYAVSRLPDEPKSGAVSRQRIVVDERGMIDLPFLILTILLSLIHPYEKSVLTLSLLWK